MTHAEEKLLDALIACRDRFAFYVGHHLEKGDTDKAAENYKFVTLANKAMTAARQSEPPNFCARCGKRTPAGDVHTCTPPTSRDAALEKARAEEREACAKECDSYGGIWQQEVMAETARKLAGKIRARGQQ